jgi:hypothetical protein
MRRQLVAICAVALVLTGCSAAGPESAGPKGTASDVATASSAEPTSAPKDSKACTLLTAKDRRSIAGDSLVTSPVRVIKGADQCKWVTSLAATTRVLYILNAPARYWAKNVPAQVDQVIRGGRADKKMLDKLQEARKKVARGTDNLDNDLACKMFSLLAEANGHKKGTNQMTAFPPVGGQFSANARICTKGIYTTVTYTEPTLKPNPTAGQAVTRLMYIAHARAIKQK